jgi:hypothetical protein
VIVFLCPNGHKIRCQEDQAGRIAKCPQCGVKFRIPNQAEMKTLPTIDSDPSISRPDFTESSLPNMKPPSQGAGIKEHQIEFLCPNGHRLHGPASLQGKPGECPDCGSRFHIPTYDEVPAEEKATQTTSSAGSEHNGQGMSALFANLWSTQSESGKIEIHFRDGGTLAPQQFLKNLSTPGLAVFSVQEPDGTTTLTAAAWDTIARIVVRGLKSVPKKLTE